MKYLILLVALTSMSMAFPSRERRSLVGLRLDHEDGVLLPLSGGVWGWGSGAVVSGPAAVVGPSADSAVVAGPSGTIVAPAAPVLGLGLGHEGLW